MYKIYNYFKEIHVRTFYVLFSFLWTLSLSYYFVDQLFYIFTNILVYPSPFDDWSPSGPFYESRVSVDGQVGSTSGLGGSCVVVGGREAPTRGIPYEHASAQSATNHPTRAGTATQFIFTDVTEAFRTCISLAVAMAFYFNIPYILYHIWAFFVPSLFVQERKVFSKFFFLFLLLYFFASFLVIYFLFPILWSFFLKFEITTEFLKIHCETRISSYISFLFKISLISHFICQIPFFVVLFVSFQILSISDILEKRRFIYWFILLISAFIAPPDLIIQSFITLFLIVLLEICLFFIILFAQYRSEALGAGRAKHQASLRG